MNPYTDLPPLYFEALDEATVYPCDWAAAYRALYACIVLGWVLEVMR